VCDASPLDVTPHTDRPVCLLDCVSDCFVFRWTGEVIASASEDLMRGLFQSIRGSIPRIMETLLRRKWIFVGT
jgi:hypothetical protein